MQPKAAPLKWQAPDEQGSSNGHGLGAFTQGSQPELALPRPRQDLPAQQHPKTPASEEKLLTNIICFQRMACAGVK